MTLTPAEFATRHPVECVVVAKKLRWLRRVSAVVTLTGRYGAPAFTCQMAVSIRPARVKFKGGLVTTKTDKVAMDAAQAYAVLALPPVADAMSQLKQVAAGG